SIVPPTGGSMNMVLVVMPVLLLVITISGAIHFVNYWQHAAAQNIETAVQESIKMAREPVLLAGITTAIGLISLVTSTLVPVRDFGIYSAIGCLLSLVVILYGLPSILYYWPAKARPEQEQRRVGWQSYAQLILKCRWPIYALSLLCFAGGIYSLKWFRTETKVIRYFDDSSSIVNDYRYLEENLAGIIPLDIVSRFDKSFQDEKTILDRMEIVREVTQELRKNPEISGAISLPDFRPVSEIPPADAGFRVQAKFRKEAQITETRIRQSVETDENPFFAVAGQSTDLHQPGDAGIVAAGDELWRISAQSAVMSDVTYASLTAQIDATIQSVLKYHPGTQHVVTGTVPLFLRTQQAVLDSLIVSFGIAFAVIALIMAIYLRHPVSGLISMIPNILPVIAIFGLISAQGIAIDIGTMITASVALGIAVDGTLHLLSWFRSGISRGLSRKQAIIEGVAHCAPAMCQTSLIISLGLLVLYPTELLLVSRFAWVTSSLVGAALIGDLVLLPALLMGRLGMLIERNICGVPETVPITAAVGKKLQPHAMKMSPRAARSKLG
ncbi:MAG: efflux RND transporter permease subunit, partial [Planctomycetaceae bacterium]